MGSILPIALQLLPTILQLFSGNKSQSTADTSALSSIFGGTSSSLSGNSSSSINSIFAAK